MDVFTFSEVHISEIRVGDIIKHDGKIVTVNKSNLTYCELLGHKIFGDSYKIGYQPVLKAIYHNPLQAS